MILAKTDQTVLSGPYSHAQDPLAFSKHRQQTLCYDREGWGPLSPTRFDFTPCFLDVLVVALAVFGVTAGSAAVVYLLRLKRPAPVAKNWHFYAKLVRAQGIPH